MKKQMFSVLVVPALCCGILMLTPAISRGQVYWDTTGATLGFGTASGTWAAPTPGPTIGWSTSSTGNAAIGSVTTTTSSNVNFGSGTHGLAAGTITVSGTVAAGPITFAATSGAITLAGGTINLTANQITSVDNASTNTINSVLSGAGTRLTVGGSGTLALNGLNTFTGEVVIGDNTSNALTLQFNTVKNVGGGSSSLGAPTTAANGIIQIGATSRNSTLEFTGATAAASTNRQVLIGTDGGGSGGAIIENNNANAAHTLTFSNAAFNVAATGSASAFNRTLTLGGSNTGNNTIAGAIINHPLGSGGIISLVKSGAGTWVLSGNSSYNGVTNVTAGTLTISHANALGSTVGGTNVASGARVFTGTSNTTFAEDFSIAGAGIGGANGAINIGGSATGVIFSGAITLSADATIKGDGSTSSQYTGGIALGGDTLTMAGDGGSTMTVDTNGISGVGGSLVKAGSGTLNLNAANTYSGSTTISAGVVQLGDVNALQNTSGISMATGTTLRPTLANVTVNAPITTAGTVTIGAPTVALGNQAFNEFILNGAIGGTGSVTFNNINNTNQIYTVTLGAAGTYSGTTLLQNTAGTAGQIIVKLGVDDALPTTTVVTIDGQNGSGSGRVAEINMNGFSQTLAGLTNVTRSLRTQRIVNPNNAAAATLTINGATDTTFSGNLGSNSANFSLNPQASNAANGNNFGLTKNGSGTFTLSGANQYSGDTKVLGGILSLGNAAAMNQSPLDTLNSVAGDAANGLRTTVTTLTMGGLTGNKNLADVFTTTAGGYSGLTALTLNPIAAATHSYSGGIADGAPGMTLRKTGLGTQVLSGNNTYTGTTTIDTGTLVQNGNYTGGGNFIVNAGGRLEGSGTANGDLIVNGGTVAPGTSIESLGGFTSFDFDSGTFEYELNTSAATADLLYGGVGSDLTLLNDPILNLIDLGSGSTLSAGSKFTLIAYDGAWNSGIFQGYADDSLFTFAGNEWLINYDDISPGVNFLSDAQGVNSAFVTITATPEPSTWIPAVMGLFALVIYSWRQHRQRSLTPARLSPPFDA